MKKIAFFLVILITSCEKSSTNSNDETPTITPNESFLFTDGFEVSNNDINALFPQDQSRWTNIQRANPVGFENEIEIVNTPVSEGANALRIFSNKSNTILSKLTLKKKVLWWPQEIQ